MSDKWIIVHGLYVHNSTHYYKLTDCMKCYSLN